MLILHWMKNQVRYNFLLKIKLYSQESFKNSPQR